MAKIITLLFIILKKQYKFNKILLAYSGVFEFFDTIFVVSLIHAVLTLAAAALQNKNQSPLYGRVTKKYAIYRNNNKKKPVGKFETVGTKFFFYEYI